MDTHGGRGLTGRSDTRLSGFELAFVTSLLFLFRSGSFIINPRSLCRAIVRYFAVDLGSSALRLPVPLGFRFLGCFVLGLCLDSCLFSVVVVIGWETARSPLFDRVSAQPTPK